MGTGIIRYFSDDADYFAVSSFKEFLEVKRYTDKPVLVLDPILEKSELKFLIEFKAELCVSNMSDFLKIKQAANSKKVKVHLAVNTGMNRFGQKNLSEIKTIISQIKKTQNIELVGVFSHYFEANNENFAKIQYEKFKQVEALVKKIYEKNVIFHISNSDGLWFYNGFDMARVGMKIYSDEMFPTINLSAKILELQKLEAGEVAGYSAVFVAKKKTTLAVVGIGYGDGIHRNIVKHGKVLVKGNFAKIVAICMDAMLVDVTGLGAELGDEVVIVGRSGENQIFICDVAKWCDTIGYEIITSLQSRVTRKIECFDEGMEYADNNREVQGKETGECGGNLHQTHTCKGEGSGL